MTLSSHILETSALYGIQAMPTFVFLRNNQEVGRLMGADAAELEKKIVRCIAEGGSAPSYSPNAATQEEKQFLEKYVHYSRRVRPHASFFILIKVRSEFVFGEAANRP